jgi:hypothetical protein
VSILEVNILTISHFDQDKCHCEEPFDRPVLSVVEGLRINSTTKQSQSSQVEIASPPSVARNDRM